MNCQVLDPFNIYEVIDNLDKTCHIFEAYNVSSETTIVPNKGKSPFLSIQALFIMAVDWRIKSFSTIMPSRVGIFRRFYRFRLSNGNDLDLRSFYIIHITRPLNKRISRNEFAQTFPTVAFFSLSRTALQQQIAVRGKKPRRKKGKQQTRNPVIGSSVCLALAREN